MRVKINLTLFASLLTILAASITVTGRADNEQFKNKYIKNQLAAAQAAQMRSGPGFELNGALERGRKTRYSVNGEDFNIDTHTEMVGDLSVGKPVHAVGKIKNGQKMADSVVVTESNQSISTSATDGLGAKH